MNDRYRPLTARKRLFVVALALGTAATVLLSLIHSPGSPPRPAVLPTPDTQRCAPGETTGCVGGTAAVIALPASATP